MKNNSTEFWSKDQIFDALCEHIGFNGRLLSLSKIPYRETYPNNFVIFNSNLVTKEFGKIWFGDIDTAVEGGILKRIAEEANITLYLLREMDARFKKENEAPEVLVAKAIWDTTKEPNERPPR